MAILPANEALVDGGQALDAVVAVVAEKSVLRPIRPKLLRSTAERLFLICR